MKVVGLIGGLPSDVDLCAGTGERRWDQLLAQTEYSRHVLAGDDVTPDGNGQREDLALRRGLNDTGPEAWVAGQHGFELHEVWPGIAGPSHRDDLDRVLALAWEVSLDGQVALFGWQVGRQRGYSALTDVQAEYRYRRQDHQSSRQYQAHGWTAHHPSGHGSPDPGFGSVGAPEVPAHDGQAQRVHPIADQAEHRRQEGQRCGDGYDSDDHRAGRQAAKDGDRYQEHAEQGDNESAPAEEHGAASGGSRHPDRRLLAAAVAAFLPEARDHEQRVVDAERQAHSGHHVDDEDREAELPGEQRSDAQAHDDGQQSHQHRHQAGDHGAEHQQQDYDGDSQAEGQFPVPQVARRQGREVVPDRVVAGDGHREPA